MGVAAVKNTRQTRRFVRQVIEALEDRDAPALFGPIDTATNVGTRPESVVVADFNRDGAPDIAVANSGNNNVAVLFGDGLGHFMPGSRSPFAVGSFPSSVAVGDFNSDGRPDLVTANFGGGSVTILLGNGSADFRPAAGSPLAVGVAPISVAVGDFNGDGRPDLAVANQDSDNVTILLGNGSGGFSPAAGSPVAAGDGPRSV